MQLQTSAKKESRISHLNKAYFIEASKEPQKILHPELVKESEIAITSDVTKVELKTLVNDISNFQDTQISDYSEFINLCRDKTFQDNLSYFLKTREEFEKTSTIFNILKNKLITKLIEKDIIDEKGWFDEESNGLTKQEKNILSNNLDFILLFVIALVINSTIFLTLPFILAGFIGFLITIPLSLSLLVDFGKGVQIKGVGGILRKLYQDKRLDSDYDTAIEYIKKISYNIKVTKEFINNNQNLTDIYSFYLIESKLEGKVNRLKKLYAKQKDYKTLVKLNSSFKFKDGFINQKKSFDQMKEIFDYNKEIYELTKEIKRDFEAGEYPLYDSLFNKGDKVDFKSKMEGFEAQLNYLTTTINESELVQIKKDIELIQKEYKLNLIKYLILTGFDYESGLTTYKQTVLIECKNELLQKLEELNILQNKINYIMGTNFNTLQNTATTRLVLDKMIN